MIVTRPCIPAPAVAVAGIVAYLGVEPVQAGVKVLPKLGLGALAIVRTSDGSFVDEYVIVASCGDTFAGISTRGGGSSSSLRSFERDNILRHDYDIERVLTLADRLEEFVKNRTPDYAASTYNGVQQSLDILQAVVDDLIRDDFIIPLNEFLGPGQLFQRGVFPEPLNMNPGDKLNIRYDVEEGEEPAIFMHGFGFDPAHDQQAEDRAHRVGVAPVNREFDDNCNFVEQSPIGELVIRAGDGCTFNFPNRVDMVRIEAGSHSTVNLQDVGGANVRLGLGSTVDVSAAESLTINREVLNKS